MRTVIFGRIRTAFMGIVLTCTLTPLMRAQGQCDPQALTVAQMFIHAQFQGASIGGSPDAFMEARGLMIEDGEPPVAPIVFVASYDIKEAKSIGEECRVKVLYQRLGTISPETLTLRTDKSEETIFIWLAHDAGAWKVHMDANHYGIPPHVGIDAAIHWLHLFSEPPADAKVVRAKQLLELLGKYN